MTDLKVLWAERKAELANITAADIATVNDWASANGVPHATPPIN